MITSPENQESQTEKENKKTKYILTFLFLTIMGLGFLYVYHNAASSEGVFSVEKDSLNIKLKKSDIVNQQGELKDHEVELQNQVTTLELLKKTIKENAGLTRTVDSLITLRRDDLSKAKELSLRFQIFNDLDGKEQNDFLAEVYTFLSKEKNPRLYVDVGAKAKSMIDSDKIARLVSQNKTYEQNYNSLLTEVQNLRSENRILRKRLREVSDRYEDLKSKFARQEELYEDSQRMLKNQRKMAEQLQEQIEGFSEIDTTLFAEEIAKLKDEKKRLEVSNENLEQDVEVLHNDAKKMVKLGIKNIIFEPLGTKRRANDGTYKLSQIEELYVSFTPKANVPSLNNSKEKLRIVYSIPIKGSNDFKIIEQEWNVVLGQPISRIIRPPLDFSDGLYTVQVFHDKTSSSIPLDIGKFPVRKFTSPRLRSTKG